MSAKDDVAINPDKFVASLPIGNDEALAASPTVSAPRLQREFGA